MHPDSVEALARECAIFCQYMTGLEPDRYVLAKYHEAHAKGVMALNGSAGDFDRLLLTLARLHPYAVRIVDAYATRFARHASLRKKLVLLLAILESCPPEQYGLEVLTPTSRTLMGLQILSSMGAFALAFGLSMVLLLPVQLIMARRPGALRR